MIVKIASAQYPITAHSSFEAWAAHTERWVAEGADLGAGLLLFPEYGAMELVSIFEENIQRDIRLQVHELNTLNANFCRIFAQLSTKYNVTIVAPSIPVVENNAVINRAYVFSQKGLAGYQDKFFMTRFENEEWGIESGKKQLTLFQAPWGNFGIQICYDVEFSIGAQALCAAGASVILAPSCTETIRGATRVHVGARARALENQAYVVVSQTIGNAAWSPAVDINYGYAGFYSTPDKGLPDEGILATMPAQTEGWLVQELDLDLIEAVRKDGSVFNFQDHRRIDTHLKDETVWVRSAVI